MALRRIIIDIDTEDTEPLLQDRRFGLAINSENGYESFDNIRSAVLHKRITRAVNKALRSFDQA